MPACLVMHVIRRQEPSLWQWMWAGGRRKGHLFQWGVGAAMAHAVSTSLQHVSISLPLQDLYRPFKLNIAAIGNIVSQLHVHITGRLEVRLGGVPWGLFMLGACRPRLEMKLHQKSRNRGSAKSRQHSIILVRG